MTDQQHFSAPRRLLQRLFRREWYHEAEFLDGYLRNVSGIIHVGANHGQERDFYNQFGLNVVWIEAIPDVYERLLRNIQNLPDQRAYRALLTDKEGEVYSFKVANNGGASSSIFDFDKHAEIWPEIQYEEEIQLTSTTLKNLMSREGLRTSEYQALTMDVEGAELLVMKGAGDLISQFRYIKAEVADFTPRVGSPLTDDLVDFLNAAGFEELIRRPFANGPGGQGTYWDIVWKKKVMAPIFHRPRGSRLPLIANDVSGVGWDKLPD